MKVNYFTNILVFLLLIGFISQETNAQNKEVMQVISDYMDTIHYNKAISELVLLRNDAETIPVGSLTRRSIAYVSLGNTNTVFPGGLELYGRINRIDPAETLLHQKEFSTYILEITLNQDSNAVIDFFRSVSPRAVVILSVFGASVTKTMHEQADAIIYSPNSDDLTRLLAAQQIFGGTVVSATLGKSMGIYPKGYGILQSRHIRLGYAPLETVGFKVKDLRNTIRSIIEQGLTEKAYPGAQVLFVKDGNIVMHQCYGYSTYDSSRILREDDIYDLASITKVTAALPSIMKLYDEGKIDLNACFSDYWPAFKRKNKKDITWKEILSHQSGLEAWIPYWKDLKNNRGHFKRRWVHPDSSGVFKIQVTDKIWVNKHIKKYIYKRIKKSPVKDQKGFIYSGLSFYLIPEIVKKITGMNFEEFTKEVFYKPLGASTLQFNPKTEFPLDRIIPTEKDTFFRNEQIHGTVHDEGAILMGGISGNAGLFGSGLDLAKIFWMYLNHGVYGEERFVDSTTIALFTSCVYCQEGNHRGLGFDKPFIEYDEGKASYSALAPPTLFGHSGYTGTLVWADPTNKLLFIFLSNRVYPTRLNRKLYELNIRPKLHQVLYESVTGIN